MENKIETNNAVINAYIKVENWIKENVQNVLDENFEYVLTSDSRGGCEWTLFITKDCKVYISKNIINYIEFSSIKITSKGVFQYNVNKTNGWNFDNGKWDKCDGYDKYWDDDMGIIAMKALLKNWHNGIKKCLQTKIEDKNFFLSFEV